MPPEAFVRVVKIHRKNLETEILFDERRTQVTEVTRPYSSFGTEEHPVQPYMEPARGGNLARPYMDTARSNPLRVNSDQAKCSCIDLRMQGEPGQSTDNEERTRSPIKSLMKRFPESPNKDQLMTELFS